MKYEAILVRAVAGGLEFSTVRLYLGSYKDLERMRGKYSGAVFIFAAKDNVLQSLNELDKLVVDNKKKHAKVSLYRELKLKGNDKRIPFLKTAFGDTGRLKIALSALFKNLETSMENNIYLLEVSDAQFLVLREEAGDVDYVEGNELSDHLSYVKVPSHLRSIYIGNSRQTDLVRKLITKAADKDYPVMILGPTGSGKEIVARAIHDLSQRNNESFIAVNCGGIPEHLVESDLFGHERGAFTGATKRKKGLWQVADGGTLFLDEIGDLRMDHQASVLRALQENEIRRVGGTDFIPVNARIIGATNKNLYHMMQQGTFRKDLYYRFRSFQIQTPSLADIKDDIQYLADKFWKDIAEKDYRPLSKAVMDVLLEYNWPGNGRELMNFLKNVYALFHPATLKAAEVKSVFKYERNINIGGGIRRIRKDRQSFHRWDCTSHLIRVGEIIRAFRVAIATYVSRKKTPQIPVDQTATTLDNLIAQLDLLNDNPLLFHDKKLFSNVVDLTCDCREFYNMFLTNQKKASAFWKKGVEAKYEYVMAEVFEVMRGLE